MKMYLLLYTALTLLLMPSPGIASGGHNHDTHGEQSIQADGEMILVGSQTSKGVKGTAQIRSVAAKMAEMGMKTTHHFMINFVDVETGEPVSAGDVALKLTNPDAKVGEPIELVGMDGHFGVDLTLDIQGEYHFRLDTRLADGTKRKFHFHYVYQ